MHWMVVFRQKALWLMPCLFIFLYTAPLLMFQLPNYESIIGEEYQPIKTLKFFSTRGQAFEKWAPVENFLLAPGYAGTLTYWAARGSFRDPSSTFPYGFQDPIHQLSTLILQGRLVYLLFACVCISWLAEHLTELGATRLAISGALLFCVATNPVMLKHFVILKPDGPMLAFSALALAMYADILSRGWSIPRGTVLGLFVSLAFGAKEIAGPIFVLPGLALVALGAGSLGRGADRRQVVGGIGAAAAMAVTSYVALNVWYAPQTWLNRMRFWVGGSGANAAIWAPPRQTFAAYAVSLAREALANLGPGGAPLALVVVVALIVSGTWRERALLLPLISFVIFGLVPVRYAPDYFLMPLALTAVLPVCWGLDRLLAMPRSRGRSALMGLLGVAAVANLVYANLAWIDLGANVTWLVERHAVDHVPKGSRIWIADLWSRVPGRSRLDWLGYRLDSRGASELARDRRDLPRVIYVDPAMQHWLDQAPESPARIQMLKESAAFSLNEWPGFEGLGYELRETIKPVVPWWWPFGWLPRGESNNRDGVLVYWQREAAAAVASAGSERE